MNIGKLTDIVALALLLEVIGAAISVGYTLRIYQHSQRTSRTFRTIVRDDLIKVIAGAWIGALVIIRLVPSPDPVTLPAWTVLVSTVAIVALLWPPIDHALTFRRLRQQRIPPRPPPFDIDD